MNKKELLESIAFAVSQYTDTLVAYAEQRGYDKAKSEVRESASSVKESV